MISIRWIKIALISIALAPIFVSAGVIEADIDGDGSNLGFRLEGSNLEWMDFSVSNSYSYNDAVSQLAEGGAYEGWSLATQAQVVELWDKTFFSITNQNYDPDQFGVNWGYTHSVGWSDAEKGEFESMFNIMGSSGTINSGTSAEQDRIFAVFSTDTGFIGNAYASIYEDSSWGHYAGREGQYHPNADSVSGTQYDVTKYSMMLVRVASVPEPQPLALLALGLVGLGLGRRKKHKSI